MALTNSQMEEILHKYDVTRMENDRILSERRQYVYEHVEGFKELDSSTVAVSMDYAKRRLNSDEDSIEELHALIEDLRDMKSKLLKGAGLPEDYLEPIYTCPECKDTGYIGTKKCRCLVRQITDILYDQSNIRTLLEDDNFDKLSYKFYKGEDLERFQKAVTECKNFIDDFKESGKNILLYGTVGTGKSFLSGCVAKSLIDNGYSVIYYSAISLFEALAKETFHSDSKDDLYNLNEYLYNCDLLIIDDLGTETTNSFTASQLFKLINERNLRNKSVIISTNLSLEEIRDRYSDRVFSRLVKSYTALRLSGTDIRVQLKQLQNRK